MKVTLLVIGKTDMGYIKEGIDLYLKRLQYYTDFRIEVIPGTKKTRNLNPEQKKDREGKMILSGTGPGKELHLLDEHGKMYSSRQFASFLEKRMITGSKELIFVIGGPYGFSESVREKADSKISLSRMTFSHQLARLLFIEQIYRAFTIINGEPYHND